MMKQIVLLGALIVLASAQNIDPNQQRSTISKHDQEIIEWWLSAGRGLWAGYMKVFHHGQYTLDARCFKKESES